MAPVGPVVTMKGDNWIVVTLLACYSILKYIPFHSNDDDVDVCWRWYMTTVQVFSLSSYSSMFVFVNFIVTCKYLYYHSNTNSCVIIWMSLFEDHAFETFTCALCILTYGATWTLNSQKVVCCYNSEMLLFIMYIHNTLLLLFIEFGAPWSEDYGQQNSVWQSQIKR